MRLQRWDERDEKRQRKEPIDQSPDDGVLRRGAGDAAARAAHHRPDDRPRPSSASGGPVRGFAQATSGARGRGVRGRPARIPASTLDFITSANPTGILSTFIAATVQPSWKEHRNQIARSDVADNAIYPISATEPPELQLASPWDLLHTSMTPPMLPSNLAPCGGACVRALFGPSPR